MNKPVESANPRGWQSNTEQFVDEYTAPVSCGLRHLVQILTTVCATEIRANNSDLSKPLLKFSDISVSAAQFIEALQTVGKHCCLRFQRDVLPVNIADFDGTLIKDSSGPFMFDMVAKERFLRPVIRHRIDEMLKFFDLERQPGRVKQDDLGMHADLIRIKTAFQQFLRQPAVDSSAVVAKTRAFYEMCSWMYAGHTAAEVEGLTRRALRETG